MHVGQIRALLCVAAICLGSSITSALAWDPVCVMYCGDPPDTSDRTTYRPAVVLPSPAEILRRESLRFNELGIQRDRDGDLEGALASFKAAYAADPSNPVFRSNIASVEGRIAWRKDDLGLALKKVAEARRYWDSPHLRRTGADIARRWLKEVDERDVWLVRRGHYYRTHLNNLKTQFEDRVKGFSAWARESNEQCEHIFKVALEQATGAVLLSLVEGVLEGKIEQQAKIIKEHIKGIKDVRLAKRTEDGLKALVDNFREEIREAVQGKSRDEAREIAKRVVTARLKQASGTALKDASKVADVAGDIVAKKISYHVIPAGKGRFYIDAWRDDGLNSTEKPKPLPDSIATSMRKEVEEAYPVLISTIKVASNHGVKAAENIAKAAPILMLLPQTIEWLEIFARASIDRTNIEALDQLNLTALREVGLIQKGNNDAQIPSLQQIIKSRHQLQQNRVVLHKWIALDRETTKR